MKLKGIVGRKIVGARQQQHIDHHGTRYGMDVAALLLDDGSELHFVVLEGTSEYAVDVVRRGVRRRKVCEVRDG